MTQNALIRSLLTVLSNGKLLAIAIGTLFWVPLASAQLRHSVENPPGSSSAEITSFSIKNVGEKVVSNALVSLAVPFQTGDIPVGKKVQLRKNDGTTVVT